MIKFINTTKRYGNIYALRDVNFEVEMGEFVFIVGPSGAGKTSILKLLYREEVATSGTVLVGRVDISQLKSTQVPKLRRRMGIVFQDFKLLPGQTAFDNVAYVLRAFGVGPTETRKRVLGALKVVGLIDKVDATPEELSGGEQQRVALARALINRPAIVLADEPTGNLDSKNSEIVLAMLRQSNQELGQTVMMITHNPEAASYGDRILHMRDGQIVAPEEDPQWSAPKH